jgi:magnesium chelatase family protein
MRVGVPRLPYRELREKSLRERSTVVRSRVIAARERMTARLGAGGRRSNAEMMKRQVEAHCELDAGGERMMSTVISTRRISARGYHRLLRVARTVADLQGADRIGVDHLALALLLRGDADRAHAV